MAVEFKPEVAVGPPTPAVVEIEGERVPVMVGEAVVAGPAEPVMEGLGENVPAPLFKEVGVEKGVGRVGVGVVVTNEVRDTVVQMVGVRLGVKVPWPVGSVRVGVYEGLRVGLKVVLMVRVTDWHPEVVMVLVGEEEGVRVVEEAWDGEGLRVSVVVMVREEVARGEGRGVWV